MTSILRWALSSTLLAALGAVCSAAGCGSDVDGGVSTGPDGCPLDFETNPYSWPSGSCEPGQACSTGGGPGDTCDCHCGGKACSCQDGMWDCRQWDDWGPCGLQPASWVGGYYVGYQRDLLPPEEIEWSGLTHLMIGAVLPRVDGTLDTSLYLDPAQGPALGKQLAGLAHQNGKKAIVMLGGAGAHDAFASAASPANRPGFVAALGQLAADWGVDGFDLDWEPLLPADYADVEALAQDLREALPGTILTLPVGWVNSNSPAVDAFYAQVAPLFDQINIMTYGMAGAWEGWQSWHSAALVGEGPTTPSSVDSSVKAYVAAGVPAAKLGVGIGFFGTCWSSPVSGPGQDLGGSVVVASDNVMTYGHIMSDYFQSDGSEWDATTHTEYLSFAAPTGPEGCTFVSYEGTSSILSKGHYVRQMGLGGAIVWTINQGYGPSDPPWDPKNLMKILAAGFFQ